MIFELSQLLTQFNTKAQEQANISLYVQEQAQESLHNVWDTNSELKQAQEYQKGSTHYFTALFCLLTVLLWMWEYMNTLYVKA